jgi:hypothetical protein
VHCPLIEKLGRVGDGDILGALDEVDDVVLTGERVGIPYCPSVEIANIVR